MREGQKSLVEQQQKEQQHTPPQVPPAPSSQAGLLAGSQLSHMTTPGSAVASAAAHENKRASSSDSFDRDRDRDSPILNLSSKSAIENNSDLSADDDVYVSDNDDDLASNDDKPKMDKDSDKSEDKVNNNGTNALATQVNMK